MASRSRAEIQGHDVQPATIEIRDNRSGQTILLQVIGMLDLNASNLGRLYERHLHRRAHVHDSRPSLRAAHGIRLPRRAGADVHATALLLGKTFLHEGFDVKEAQKEFRYQSSLWHRHRQPARGLHGLGLIVGIAALGVIAFRSVVERRQQIGMMRAIGFRKGMVRTAFLIESSFIAIWARCWRGPRAVAGKEPGGQYCQGQLQRRIQRAMDSDRADHRGCLRGVVDHTFVPAWQASRVYPAEALRYE